MKIKSKSVECAFNPALTQLLFLLDEMYNEWEDEVIITSGSEMSAQHSRTSLHYAGCAVDIRTWSKAKHGRGEVPDREVQHSAIKELVEKYCKHLGVPADWIDVVLEKTHIHIELQPKRVA